MRGDLLSALNRAAIFEIGRDASGAKRMTGHDQRKPRFQCPPLNNLKVTG